MPISEQTYERVALEDPEGKWEYYCGQLRSKPGMTTRHNRIGWRLGFWLQQQLDLEQFEVRVDAGRARRPGVSFSVPDVMVIPTPAVERMEQDHPNRLEVYVDPLPLIVEVWSASTGGYDVTTKLEEYRRRGDAETWFIHPRDRTLTAWRRQPDGSYTESVHTGGAMEPVALAGVRIDLDALLA